MGNLTVDPRQLEPGEEMADEFLAKHGRTLDVIKVELDRIGNHSTPLDVRRWVEGTREGSFYRSRLAAHAQALEVEANRAEIMRRRKEWEQAAEAERARAQLPSLEERVARLERAIEHGGVDLRRFDG